MILIFESEKSDYSCYFSSVKKQMRIFGMDMIRLDLMLFGKYFCSSSSITQNNKPSFINIFFICSYNEKRVNDLIHDDTYSFMVKEICYYGQWPKFIMFLVLTRNVGVLLQHEKDLFVIRTFSRYSKIFLNHCGTNTLL